MQAERDEFDTHAVGTALLERMQQLSVTEMPAEAEEVRTALQSHCQGLALAEHAYSPDQSLLPAVPIDVAQPWQVHTPVKQHVAPWHGPTALSWRWPLLTVLALQLSSISELDVQPGV